jgi:DNA-binding SARP family transcriptional activator
MGLLRLAVLGPPEVVHDGSRLTFALRKAQALLLYLAVEGGMHSRSKLSALLWPDSELHDARTSLRSALLLLRTLLPDASPAPHSHLHSERDLLGLNPQAPLELDLAVVQQAYREAQRLSTLPAEPQRAALVAQCQQALALVRGPFLDGFWLGEESPFDEWVLRGQQQWQVRVQLLCERLSSWQEAGFELEQARATLTRWLALDPLAEEAYLQSLAVLAAWDGHSEQAIGHLREAAGLAADIGLLGERWQIQAALGTVYEAGNEPAQARTAFAEAARIIGVLAGGIKDKARRSRFLAGPQIHPVLQHAQAEASPVSQDQPEPSGR